MRIQDDICTLKGVGGKTKENLNKCGIFTLQDLVLYFPRDYEKISSYGSINNCSEKEKITLTCYAKEILKDVRTKTGRLITTIIFYDGNDIFKGKWFNQPYIKNKFKPSFKYNLQGKVEIFNGERILINPKIVEQCLENIQTTTQVIPKYPLRDGVTNSLIIKLVTQVLNNIRIDENLPSWIIDKYKLCPLDKAIRNIHQPGDPEALNLAIKRLKFQELFAYSLKVLMIKEFLNKSKKGIEFSVSPDLVKLKDSLDFKLTDAQSRAIREIISDQKKSIPMNRLVQGDVGSGKTIVAIIAMFNVVKNGYQAAFMAPTEILANQHFIETCKLLKNFSIRIELLTGSLSQKEKSRVKSELSEGTIDIIIGTHALIEDDVEFSNLGLVVTDEQHRFGVLQRSKLFNKNNSIDILVMTATPIPRTLSLCLYSDLDLSIIDELPPGRQKIDTHYLSVSERHKAYEFANKQIKEGRQVYIVCPLVEQNEESDLHSVEKIYLELKDSYFNDIECAVLFGKMPPKEKDGIMNKFKNGEVKAIISTTVIEVGVNVPNATVMIVENAERFGLAQLHQLRGRVGRGSFKSYCILLADIKNETVKKRMEILKNSNDGFFIAEQDLKIRGSGELLGFRQHGEDNLILCDFIDDMNILKAANAEAKVLINSEEEADMRIKDEIIKSLENSSKYICFN